MASEYRQATEFGDRSDDFAVKGRENYVHVKGAQTIGQTDQSCVSHHELREYATEVRL